LLLWRNNIKKNLLNLIIVLSAFVIFLTLSLYNLVFFGITIYLIIIAITLYNDKTSQIPEDYWKRKDWMKNAKIFWYVFLMMAMTMTLSWITEIAMENFDFAGMKDNMNLVLIASIGGIWGFGMAELLYLLKENEKTHPNKILSDSFKEDLKKTLKQILIILVWFFTIISLMFHF